MKNRTIVIERGSNGHVPGKKWDRCPLVGSHGQSPRINKGLCP